MFLLSIAVVIRREGSMNEVSREGSGAPAPSGHVADDEDHLAF